MKHLITAFVLIVTGLCNCSAQTVNAKETIDRLARDAGSRHEGVKHVAIPPSEDSATVEDWLARNRDSIEGTRGGPFYQTSQYVTTFCSDRIYVHILGWNRKKNIALPAVIDRPVQKAWLLDGGAPVRVDESPWGMIVVVPEEQRPSGLDTVVVLRMPGNIDELREPRTISPVPSMPILLLGDSAELNGSGIHYNPGPDWIEGWTSTSDLITWKVRTPLAGWYDLAITYSCAPGCAGAKIQIMANRNKVLITTQETHGVWRGWNAFERIPIRGRLFLTTGVNEIRVRALQKSSTDEIIRLDSLSLSLPQAKRSTQLANDRTRAIRADASWLRAAKYGLMVHWLPGTMPQSGRRKEFCDAVHDFDVERFAEMVKTTGAGYLVFTVAQLQYFAAPFQAVDAVLRGRTCKDRDLLGDLASALASRNIRLILYYHHGVGDPEWVRAAGFLQSDKSGFFRQEAAILSEAGHRYGDKLAGWWFDDRYPFQPFEQLDKAAKNGNPARIVAFNSWVLPMSTPFQDYWAGEAGGDVPSLPTSGYFDDSGPASGLQPHFMIFLDDPWVHGTQDTKIHPPRLSDSQLIDFISNCNRKGAPVTMNIGVYQDGSASPATLEQLAAARKTSAASRSLTA